MKWGLGIEHEVMLLTSSQITCNGKQLLDILNYTFTPSLYIQNLTLSQHTYIIYEALFYNEDIKSICFSKKMTKLLLHYFNIYLSNFCSFDYSQSFGNYFIKNIVLCRYNRSL
jgi:hypothetical protein